MVPTKRSAKSDATLVVSKVEEKVADAQASAAAKMDLASSKVADAGSKLPSVVQFALTVALSFALSTLGSVVMSQVSKGELQSLRRSPDTWNEVAISVGWRIIELALAWFGTRSSSEAAALDVLAHGPAYYLLVTFYELSPATALAALAIDSISVALPFYLVLPLSTPDDSAAQSSNRELLDVPMRLLTTILSAAINAVTTVLSLRFLMPRIFVVHFDGLPTLAPAYTASYVDVLPVTAIFGLAASTFIYAPYAATGEAPGDVKVKTFDPVNASLGETVWWNVWGYTAKSKVVIRRTATAAALTGISTYLACTQHMYGIDSDGAIAYASIWVASAVLAGVGFGFVGSV